MKFDKQTVIAIVLCVVFLMGWQFAVNKIWPKKPRVQNKPGIETPSNVNTVKPEDPKKIPEKQPEDTVVAKDPEKEPVKDPEKQPDNKTSEKIAPDVKLLEPVSIENDFIVATVDPNKGDISSIKMKKYFTTVKDGKGFKKSDVNIVLLKKIEDGALGLTANEKDWTLTNVKAEVENKGTPEEAVSVVRTLSTEGGQAFSVTQKWNIVADYVIKTSIEVTNLSNAELTLTDVNLSAGGITKISELAGDKVFREGFQVEYYDLDENKIESGLIDVGFFETIMRFITFQGKKEGLVGVNKITGKKIKWVGVVNKYFTCILLPEKPIDEGIIAEGKKLKNKQDKEYILAEASALIDFEKIAPGTSQSMNCKYYAGPKKLDLLKGFEPTSAKVMKLYILGMSFFEFISVGFLKMLNLLKDWCGSYGLSIILLTLMVKTVLWPVNQWANKSMRKTQKIQPLVKELRKKYKDNPSQLNAEMMKLYKEHGVNPMGGCLPMLFQMPVFFALYATFSGTISPRHTAFLWMHDLSMPDTIGYIWGTSIAINPLMLMMTGTMVLQQKLTPSVGDPSQKKMMMFMPLIMLLMLYSLPSGLTLYWTVSQFISIAQLVINKKFEQRAEMREADLK